MGLLDDAIREHLELKRRHGADPEEVSRQEREALGAPARGEFAQPQGAQPPEPAEPGESEVDEELRADDADPPGSIAAGALVEDEGAAEGHGEDPWLVEELADSEERESEGEQDREDVLEGTPDFLQETPEHER